MIRSFMVIAIILAMTSAVFCAEELLLTEVTKVRLIGIKDGKATVQGLGNETAEVIVGDSVGRERGKVVEMGKSYIIVETEILRIKIPTGFRLER
jgi:Tfp pilus assembly protein PilP